MKIYVQEIIKNERNKRRRRKRRRNKEIIINQHEPFSHYVHLNSQFSAAKNEKFNEESFRHIVTFRLVALVVSSLLHMYDVLEKEVSLLIKIIIQNFSIVIVDIALELKKSQQEIQFYDSQWLELYFLSPLFHLIALL